MPSLQGKRLPGSRIRGSGLGLTLLCVCLFHVQGLVGHRPWRVCVGDLGRNGLREFVKGANLVVEAEHACKKDEAISDHVQCKVPRSPPPHPVQQLCPRPRHRSKHCLIA